MAAAVPNDQDDVLLDLDPIWTTSRTARLIYSLGEVEKDISRLLSLAASSVALLTLPQTDDAAEPLPPGDERSEQFVLEVNEFFDRLNSIQSALRSSLAHIRHSRIAPSAINAPTGAFLPPALGVVLPSEAEGNTRKYNGFQEARIERDTWKGILGALTRLKKELDEQEGAQNMDEKD